MSKRKLQGTFTALVTPFKASGEVDYDEFDRLLAAQVAGGVDGLVPIGTTGETPTLAKEEEEELIRRTVAAAGKAGIPVIAGTGSNSTDYAVMMTGRAKELGADYALVVTPYYNKPSNEGLYRHFEAVASVGLPVIVYNIMGRTARNIDTPTLERIASIDGIVGVKEASGDLNQVCDVIARIGRRKEGFTVLSGDDALVIPIIASGGDGVISVASNLYPAEIKAMVDAALSGDYPKARDIFYRFLPFIRALFAETSPAPIKAAMAMRGWKTGSPRLPLVPVTDATRALLAEAMERL